MGSDKCIGMLAFSSTKYKFWVAVRRLRRVQCCVVHIVAFPHRHIPICVHRPHLNTKIRNYFDSIFSLFLDCYSTPAEWHQRIDASTHIEHKFYDDLMTIHFIRAAKGNKDEKKNRLILAKPDQDVAK